ncbi:MAG: SusD/RagB family nutrient-binding outer membrane lipoprotein [Saprospiraceae bacterium]|nr:SusD/RagB family nutrient-binding outer membrane lipoprotein [Saprospiraceae bacterium]
MKSIYILFLLIIVSYCSTADFDSLNTDSKNPASVPGETLFTNATERFYQILNSANVNNNVCRLYAQYWAQTTYPDESQYNMITRRNPDNWFTRLYRDVLKDLDASKTIIEAQSVAGESAIKTKANKLAIIEVNVVHAYATLVDLFGDVPYSEALDFSNPSPKYDDAKTVYFDIISRLDVAINTLNPDFNGFSSSEDLINQGDMQKWLKAANSLKLRLAMRIADIDAVKSAEMAKSAVAGGVISSNSENLSLDYIVTPPYTNPVYEDLVLSGRNDFVGANTLIDKMNTLKDGRRNSFFDSNMGADVFVGGVYGSANTYNQASHLGSLLNTPDNAGTVISYSEVEFLLAEAIERGFDVGGTAAGHYENGIKASFEEWGAGSADVYLANADVAYATASGNWKQKIGTQKWIALFNNGLEGWTVWRMLDFEGFNVPEGLTYQDIPVRFIYSIGEATLNGANVKAAGAAIGETLQPRNCF